MKYKNIYVLLLIVAGSSVYAAEQSMQQEQMPRELVFELFVKDLHDYTNQEALNALKALRQTNKSFATDKGLQQAIDYMKNYNRLRPYHLSQTLLKSEITIIATLLRDQKWLKNNTESVDSLIKDLVRQDIDGINKLPVLNMLEILWPLISHNFDDFIYVSLAQGLYISKDPSADIACEIAKFLHNKNIPLNNEKTGYCEALKLMIRRIQNANKIKKEYPMYPPDPKIIEGYKILYKCLKDLGARLDPKYQEVAKEVGLE